MASTDHTLVRRLDALVGMGEAASVQCAGDRALLRSLASQLSIALENVRLHRQLGDLFRLYLSPDVATTLLADPSQTMLRGAVLEVTAPVEAHVLHAVHGS